MLEWGVIQEFLDLVGWPVSLRVIEMRLIVSVAAQQKIQEFWQVV